MNKEENIIDLFNGRIDLMNKKLPIDLLLEKTVYVIATQLNVDVCSCYLIRPGDILELYASYGLDKSALHETFLQIGEGLIGEIALQRKSLVFEDASFAGQTLDNESFRGASLINADFSGVNLKNVDLT